MRRSPILKTFVTITLLTLTYLAQGGAATPLDPAQCLLGDFIGYVNETDFRMELQSNESTAAANVTFLRVVNRSGLFCFSGPNASSAATAVLELPGWVLTGRFGLLAVSRANDTNDLPYLPPRVFSFYFLNATAEAELVAALCAFLGVTAAAVSVRSDSSPVAVALNAWPSTTRLSTQLYSTPPFVLLELFAAENVSSVPDTAPLRFAAGVSGALNVPLFRVQLAELVGGDAGSIDVTSANTTAIEFTFNASDAGALSAATQSITEDDFASIGVVSLHYELITAPNTTTAAPATTTVPVTTAVPNTTEIPTTTIVSTTTSSSNTTQTPDTTTAISNTTTQVAINTTDAASSTTAPSTTEVVNTTAMPVSTSVVTTVAPANTTIVPPPPPSSNTTSSASSTAPDSSTAAPTTTLTQTTTITNTTTAAATTFTAPPSTLSPSTTVAPSTTPPPAIVVTFSSASAAAAFSAELAQIFNLTNTEFTVTVVGSKATVTFAGSRASALSAQLIALPTPERARLGIESLAAATDAPQPAPPSSTSTNDLLLYILAPVGGVVLLAGIVGGVGYCVRSRQAPVVHFNDLVTWEQRRWREMEQELRGFDPNPRAADSPTIPIRDKRAATTRYGAEDINL
jgi:hypothetical protein